VKQLTEVDLHNYAIAASQTLELQQVATFRMKLISVHFNQNCYAPRSRGCHGHGRKWSPALQMLESSYQQRGDMKEMRRFVTIWWS